MGVTLFGANVMGGTRSPFKGNIQKRPHFNNDVVQVMEPVEDPVIEAPRTILLGRRLDKETGEDMGPFHLPIDDIDHEPSILVEGGPGTGKSVCIARMFSELVLEGRSGILCDFKGQYANMNAPNRNEKHIEILSNFGEVPRGLGKIDVWLPNHIIERKGEEYCKLKYNYNKRYIIRTEDMDAGGLLLLGGKSTEGKDYVMLLDTLLASLKKGAREGMVQFTLDTIVDELNTLKEDVDGTKRSVNVLEIMLHNLMVSGVISDNGTSIFDLIDKPRRDGKPGKVSIFNTGAAGPDDVQSKGVIANFVNALCNSLMTEWEIIDGERVNAYRPILFIDEASTYFNSYSSQMVMSAFNLLQYVDGRTLGICRAYVYQTQAQMPKNLKDSDTMPIYIKLQQFLDLVDLQGNIVGQINRPGLAKISIKNVSFMQNQEFYVQILPPKCDIGS